MIRCPKCGSNNVGQYRSPLGPIWCNHCSYRVEQKEIDKSFFEEQVQVRQESLYEDYELVQVHKAGEKVEVLIRNKNGFKAYGGIICQVDNPISVYPPDYFEEEGSDEV